MRRNFRTKRHDPAAFRASRRHGGNQADPGARRYQREDARELVALKDGIRRDPGPTAGRERVVPETVPVVSFRQRCVVEVKLGEGGLFRVLTGRLDSEEQLVPFVMLAGWR